MTEKRPVPLILTGPTGIGKTDVAVELALRHSYELISADSMQVYQGMEIGTAQPTRKELRGVPIHGCGIVGPNEPFSAQRFIEFCSEAHAKVAAAGRIPLYVGGTGMYLRALRWGLFKETGNSSDKVTAGASACRKMLQDEMEKHGPETMHARLVVIDPEYAGRIGVRDAIRIVRALEVHELTGRTMTELQSQWHEPEARFEHRLVILNCPREVLVTRIERRVEAMLEAGWIEEVRKLLASGLDVQTHAFKALGYREITAFLSGEFGLEKLREKIKAKTRQFAKRQLTWFRGEKGGNWVNYGGVSLEEAIAGVEKNVES